MSRSAAQAATSATSFAGGESRVDARLRRQRAELKRESGFRSLPPKRAFGDEDDRPWFGVTGKGPKLSGLRVRLLYQSPHVYKTDIAQFAKPASLGFRYTCKRPLVPGQAASNLGEPGEVPYSHPSFELNDFVPSVHVHLEDKKTGEVFWDADFNLKKNLLGLKGSTLSSSARPKNANDIFHRPCIPGDDPEPHLFDLSIQSQSGYYDDFATPYGDAEGFGGLGGPNAHIGFEVYRVPVLEEAPNGEVKEVLGDWTPGGNVSWGPVVPSRHERFLQNLEDPFWRDDPIKPSTGRLYYDYIISPKARLRNKAEYIEKLMPPLPGSVPNFMRRAMLAEDRRRSARLL